MNKGFSIIILMLACIFIPIIIIEAIASYYGSSDWTWIAQQLTVYYLVLAVLGVALFTLVSLIRRR